MCVLFGGRIVCSSIEENIAAKRKVNWICHSLHRNCLINQVIGRKVEGKTEVTGRRERICKHLLDDLRKMNDTGNLIKKH
jgi:hypothetical protein